MAYGRLDIFWPDGKIENIALKADNVSLGRSPGNVIPFDTESLSRYHANIYRDTTGIHIQDLASSNGTFVDGVRLEANKPTPLSGGEEIQIGYLRMTFHRLDDAPTMQMSPMEDTQRIQRENPTFRMEVQPPPIAVAPCAYTSAEISIFNNSNKPESYKVQLTGMPDNWVRISRPVVEVPPQESAVVVANIKPLRRSDSVPGVYNVVASVRSQAHTSEVLEAPFKVNILPFSGFGMALGTPRVNTGDRFRLHVHNQGSAPLPIQISGRSRSQEMQFILNPSQLTLNPGQRFQITGEARPARRRLLGSPAEYPFDLIVRSMDNAHFTVATTGRAVEKPPLPVWAGIAGGVTGALAILLILVGLLAVINRVPDPQIVQASINNGSRQIVSGEPLVLSWQAENADYVDVQVNNATILSQQPTSAQGVVIDTEPFGATGRNLNVSIVAMREGAATDVEMVSLTISDAVAASDFSITPQTLIRNVVQNVTIRYNIPGAVDVNITGLESALQQQMSLPPGSSGEVTLAILPVNDFTMTLTAATQAETTTTQTLTVLLVDPACAPIGSQPVNVYTLPDTDAPIATSINPGARVVVNARSGSWLRFSPPDLTTDAWGQRELFSCDTSFNVEDLREVVTDAPLPTRTRTPTIAAPLTVVPRTSVPIIPSGSTSVPQIPTTGSIATVTPSIPGTTSLPPLPVINPTAGPGITPGAP